MYRLARALRTTPEVEDRFATVPAVEAPSLLVADSAGQKQPRRKWRFRHVEADATVASWSRRS